MTDDDRKRHDVGETQPERIDREQTADLKVAKVARGVRGRTRRDLVLMASLLIALLGALAWGVQQRTSENGAQIAENTQTATEAAVTVRRVKRIAERAVERARKITDVLQGEPGAAGALGIGAPGEPGLSIFGPPGPSGQPGESIIGDTGEQGPSGESITGAQGEQGPPPSDAQVEAAVAAYLADHPPPAGPQGPPPSDEQVAAIVAAYLASPDGQGAIIAAVNAAGCTAPPPDFIVTC